MVIFTIITPPQKSAQTPQTSCFVNVCVFSLAVTTLDPTGKSSSHNWEFLVAVVVTAISISIIIAILAKCQVVRQYLASYRHKRLRDADVTEEDDDGFIEDNYIPTNERARAERAAESLDTDTEDDMDEIEFSIA
uniref:Uncharacterized protein n=1 Tax=Oryzias melastigma TaxID=30732 RepID=A0A3B3BRC1_ORYME